MLGAPTTPNGQRDSHSFPITLPDGRAAYFFIFPSDRPMPWQTTRAARSSLPSLPSVVDTILYPKASP